MLGCEGGGRGRGVAAGWGCPQPKMAELLSAALRALSPRPCCPLAGSLPLQQGGGTVGEKHPVHFQGSPLIEGGRFSQIPKARESR